MPEYILGVSAFFHDSAAALLRDGVIVAAAQEERFTRVKHDDRFPRRAIQYCLEEAGIGASDLSSMAYYEKPLDKFDRILENHLAVAPAGFTPFRRALPLWVSQKLALPKLFRRELGSEFEGEIHFVEHHESHAASAFFPSPFDEAAILTLDAVGEWATSSLGYGKGNRIQITHEMKYPHSVGMLYSAFTYYTGFRVNSGEYKLMGLAPYGEPQYTSLILDHIVDVRADGSIWLDMSYFDFHTGLTMTSERFHDLFGGPPRAPESRITQKDMDLAASIQVITEEIVLKSAGHLHSTTGSPNLVMAGGVALNCVANGRVLREGPFEKMWIQPAAGDAGGALGAALSIWHQHGGNPRQPGPSDSQRGSLLGPSFSNEEIEFFLSSTGAVYHRWDEEEVLLEKVGDLLASEKVVGWFQGRMEYGPRALGSRSIIGDARSRDMQKKMNLKIKFRESFRPFAPCVLREYADQVFEFEADQESPYMLLVAPVREEWRRSLTEEDRRLMDDPDLTVRVSVARSRVPAVTHVDYSARVQTVDETRHGRFARLMKRYHHVTGCPVIVNTSFNIRGEPIVGTPSDAFRCFLATDMDCLVLENYVLLKGEQPEGLAPDAEHYRSQYKLD